MGVAAQKVNQNLPNLGSVVIKHNKIPELVSRLKPIFSYEKAGLSPGSPCQSLIFYLLNFFNYCVLIHRFSTENTFGLRNDKSS